MRRKLAPFVQIAFGFLAFPLLLAQHIGPAAPPHLSGQGNVGLGSSFPAASHTSSLPSGPMALRPGVRYPSSPVLEGPRRPSTSTSPYRRPDEGRHGANYRNHDPYIYTGYPWLSSFGYGFPVAYAGLPYAGQDDAGSEPGPQQANYVEPPPATSAPEPPAPRVADNAPPAFRPAYRGEAVTAPLPQPATKLIFKDGRPPLEIHNYALTGNTLYALDGDFRQEIPLSVLNLQATVEANRAAGVDFALPTSR